MRTKKRFLLMVLCIIFAIASPASAATATPQQKLQTAINNLTKQYTQVIDDPDYDLDKLKATVDFSGVRSWSYSGERTNSQITLKWQFEWYDSFAVLAAFKNPVLVNKLNANQKNLLTKCKQILSVIILPDMTDYEKELAIHDYLVLNCEYDSATALARDTTDVTPFSAYGALFNGRAVCQGYTEAAYILLWMVGIENFQLESEDHTWNLVKLPDGYYHLDITWDDPEGNQPDVARHDFFNLTDLEIARYKQHNWSNREKYPTAEATAYQYFIYNNLYAKNVTELTQKIMDAIKANKTEVTVWVGDHTTYAYDWTRDLKFIFKYKKSYFYIPPDENRDTLTVTFN